MESFISSLAERNSLPPTKTLPTHLIVSGIIGEVVTAINDITHESGMENDILIGVNSSLQNKVITSRIMRGSNAVSYLDVTRAEAELFRESGHYNGLYVHVHPRTYTKSDTGYKSVSPDVPSIQDYLGIIINDFFPAMLVATGNITEQVANVPDIQFLLVKTNETANILHKQTQERIRQGIDLITDTESVNLILQGLYEIVIEGMKSRLTPESSQSDIHIAANMELFNFMSAIAREFAIAIYTRMPGKDEFVMISDVDR